MMNQIPSSELLSAYLDGEVTAEQRASVDAMLAQSSASRRLLAELQALRGELRSLPRFQLPADFADRVVRAAERRVLESQGAAPSIHWESAALAAPLPPQRAKPLFPQAPLEPAATYSESEFLPAVERDVPQIVVNASALDSALHGHPATGVRRLQAWHLAVGGTIAAILLVSAVKLWNPADRGEQLAEKNGVPVKVGPELVEQPKIARFEWNVPGDDEAARLGKTPGPKPKRDGGNSALAGNSPTSPEKVVAAPTTVSGPNSQIPEAPLSPPAPPASAVAASGASPAAGASSSDITLAYVAKAGNSAAQLAAVERFEHMLKSQKIALVPAAKRAVSGDLANRTSLSPGERGVTGPDAPPANKNVSTERVYVIEGTPAELQAAFEQFKALTGDADAKLALEPLGNGTISVQHENLSYGSTPAAQAPAASKPGTQRALFIFRAE